MEKMHYKPEVRLGKAEIDRILDLREEFDLSATLIDYATKYLNLGWCLAAFDAETDADLRIDFKKFNWAEDLKSSGIKASKINLGVYAGNLSQLLVIEVADEQQKGSLGEEGPWQSQCTAELGNVLEKHYYSLPSALKDLSSDILPSGVRLCADGNIALLPPSLDPLTQKRWQWQHPPWDSAPSSLPLPIWHLLHTRREGACQGYGSVDAPTVPWQELYCLISPLETVRKAFTSKVASMDEYYKDILRAALEAGLTDSEILRSLLWNAPLGDARHRPEIWNYLNSLIIQTKSGELFQSPNRTPGSPLEAPFGSREPQVNNRQPISRRGKRYA